MSSTPEHLPAAARPAPRAVLFDFFGTLVDYAPGPVAPQDGSFHQLLKRIGAGDRLDQSLRSIRQHFDDHKRRSAANRFKEFDWAQVMRPALIEAFDGLPCQASARDNPAAIQDAIARFHEDWDRAVSYTPPVKEVLERLGPEVRVGIVSNTHWAPLVPRHLRAMGLAERFDPVVLSVDEGIAKPHPSIYLRALARLSMPAAKAAFVGDSYEADFLGPRSVGMRAYLIGTEERVPERYRLGSLAELPERLLR